MPRWSIFKVFTLEWVNQNIGDVYGCPGVKMIEQFDARFSSPVIPGETITTEMWQDGNVISFSCCVQERGEIVLRNGRCILRA